MASSFRVAGPVYLFWGLQTTVVGTADTTNTSYLGTSKTGCTIQVDTHWQPLTDDKHGNMPADYVFTGKQATVTFEGLDVASLKTSGVFNLLMDATSKVGSLADVDINQMGALATELCNATGYLRIYELLKNNGTQEEWRARYAIPVDPTSLTLASTQELQLPITFLLLPNSSGNLFDQVPSYMGGS